MAISLSQAEADRLFKMDKRDHSQRVWRFPGLGGRVNIPIISMDKREHFCLDVGRSRIELAKASFQKRWSKTIILIRLDLGGTHRNPDDQMFSGPH
ncbi:MAG: hypothetical protein HQL53_05155 [Magnetococcales bacterium]|nr:hypothetical protein [Magnetococcales bacterium]